MRRKAGLLAAVMLAACNSAAVPLTGGSTAASSIRALVAAPDFADQPSFAMRTGRPPALSLQELFHPTYNAPIDPTKIRTLLVTGDVIPARGVNYFATVKRDFLWPFRPTADYTKNADITYINLEAPLFAGCPVSPAESFTFCGDARFVNGLNFMGAKVANLANIHLSPTPDDPVGIGHEAIDWGADIVIGNHPHWYQGIEVYKGKLITYAHGNFVFDQMWSEETREGVIGTYTFYGTQLVAATWKPVRSYDYGQPVFMNASDSASTLQTMEAASDTLATRLHEPPTSPVPSYPPSLPYAPEHAPA